MRPVQLISAQFLDLFSRNLKPGVRRWNARVHGGLQKHFFQIAQFEITGQTRSQVQGKLFPSSKRCCYRQHQ